jgi:DMSO/TMAO reductase YedYZ molybdopterin-dependent catalytic subunit
VTPRGTDWSLAGLVALGLASGVLTWFAGAPGDAWVFFAHDVAGAALAVVVVAKVRRVAPRLARLAGRGDRPAGAARGVFALGLVAAVLVSGAVWATAGAHAVAGYTVLFWHGALGALLGLGVLAHARVRAKPLRARDVAGRRQFLALAAGAVAVRLVQRPAERALGLPGARRRYTGSYPGFPVTSWVADDPAPLGPGYRLAVAGRALPVAALDRGHELVATLDCTGGFYTTQRWRGVRLDALLAEAGVPPGATHVRVISVTGYRWSFPLAEAPRLLLATHVAGAPLSHGHGAPCRLVAPGHRGFQWVKWVERIELHDGPDPGAPASTVLSSL